MFEIVISVLAMLAILLVINGIRTSKLNTIESLKSQISYKRDELETKRKLQEAFFSLKGAGVDRNYAKDKLRTEYDEIIKSINSNISSCKINAKILFCLNFLLIIVFALCTYKYHSPAFPFIFYSQYQIEKRITSLTNLSEQGDIHATLTLARLYRDGKEIPTNRQKAIEWFKKAAEVGDNIAQLELARFYLAENHAPEDRGRAIKLLKKAAENGDGEARNELFTLLLNGTQNEKKEGIKLLRKIAMDGDNFAQYQLGEIYNNGELVNKNVYEAKKWLKMSADRGNTMALATLKNINEALNRNIVELFVLNLTDFINQKDSAKIESMFADKIDDVDKNEVISRLFDMIFNNNVRYSESYEKVTSTLTSYSVDDMDANQISIGVEYNASNNEKPYSDYHENKLVEFVLKRSGDSFQIVKINFKGMRG